MIYGLETSTGHIYTEEEYCENYKYALPDRGVASICWKDLPKLDIPPDKLEKIRKKMLFIYSPPPPHSHLDRLKAYQTLYNLAMARLQAHLPQRVEK